MSEAWVTVAPLSIASLVAVVSWPLRVPTIRSRICLFLLRCSRATPDGECRTVSSKWKARSGSAACAGPPFATRASLFALHVSSGSLRLDDFGHGHAELL